MTAVLALHRKQFYLGPEKVRAAPDWLHQQLAPKLWLSHCPLREVGQARDCDGAEWTLVGCAQQTMRDQPDPLDAIAGCETAGVLAASDRWAGRWVLIGGEKLSLDASGLLGCYFTRSEDGVLRAASSEALLPRPRDRAFQIDDRPFVHERSMGYSPPPSSRRSDVSRLLPSQTLDLSSGELAPRRLLAAEVHDRGLCVSADEFMDALAEPIRRIAEQPEPLWVSLSGGGDSRMILAASLRAGSRPRAFTRVSDRMSGADFLLPPKLAKRAGLEHVYLDEGERIAGRFELVKAHAGGQMSLGDADPILRGGRDGLTGISLGGQGFGLGKKPCREAVSVASTQVETYAQQLAGYYGEPADSSAVPAIMRWLEWVNAHPEGSLHVCDRFYIEQGHAGWQSAKEQVYDMGLHRRFFPLNCRRTHALLLGFTRDAEPGSGFKPALVRAAAPKLLDWPINPADGSLGRMKILRARMRHDPWHVLRQLRRGFDRALVRAKLVYFTQVTARRR